MTRCCALYQYRAGIISAGEGPVGHRTRRIGGSRSSAASSSWSRNARLVAAAALLLASFQVAAGDVIAGDAGRAASFDHRRADVVSLRWVRLPTEEITVEHWVRAEDLQLSYMETVAYSTFDPYVDPPYEAANEFQVAFTPTFIRGWRGVDIVECHAADSEQCLIYGAGWVHLALSWSANTGHVRIVRDGVEIFASHPGGDFEKPLTPNGVLHLGQEADAPWSDFDELQSLDGVIDEVRIWEGVRSTEQIAAWMRRSLPDPAAEENLRLYWTFEKVVVAVDAESVVSREVVEDLSASSNDGLFGELPTLRNQMTYSTLRGPRVPTAPDLVISGAPVVGSGVTISHADTTPGARTTVLVVAVDVEDEDVELTFTVEEMPSAGGLEQMSGDAITVASTELEDDGHPQQKRFVFVADSDFEDQGTAELRIRVTNPSDNDFADVDVVVLAAGRVRTADNLEVTVAEDGTTVLNLAAGDEFGAGLVTEILSLPLRGTLYSIRFAADAQPSYGTIVHDVSQLAPVEDVGILDVVRSLVLYAPEPDGYGQDFDSFEYRFIGEDGSVGTQGTVSIHVSSVNDAPTADQARLVIDDTATAAPVAGRYEIESVVQLNAEDVDGSFSPDVLYSISSWPRMGRLYQYSETYEDGLLTSVRGDPIEEVERVPIIIQFADAVMNASSQFSLCGDSCFNVLSCNENACADIAWHASQILGEPDVYPRYGDIKQGWDLSTENAGHEWIELRMPFALHISQVDIYETYKPGAVIRISGAAEYRGAETDWTMLWNGEPTPGLEEKARVFSPNVCVVPSERFEYVRIDLDTAAIPGWNNYDAVSTRGSIDLPPGAVTDPAGRVVYAAPASVFGGGEEFDSFAFVASDCASTSSASVVSVDKSVSYGVVSQPYSVLSTSAAPGERNALLLDFAELEAKGVVDDQSAFDLRFLRVEPLYGQLAEDGQAAALFASDSDEDEASLPLDTAEATLYLQPAVSSPALRVLALVTVANYSYALEVHVEMDCQSGYFPRSTDGACVTCEAITTAENVLRMEAQRHFSFRDACDDALRCGAGQFRDDWGPCESCPAGSVRSADDGDYSACDACAVGSEPSTDQSSCIQFVDSETPQGLWIALVVALSLAFLSVCYVYARHRAAKRKERRMRRLADQREQAAALAASEKQNKSKRAFLRYALHELRVPFTSVTLGLETLVEELGSHLSGEALELITMCREGAESMNHVLDDVLSMQKIEDGALELEVAPFNLREMIRMLQRTMSSMARHNDVSIDVDMDDAIPQFLLGDVHRLRQVVSNLISNAVKFSPSGGTVKLTIALEQKPRAVRPKRFMPQLLRLTSGHQSPRERAAAAPWASTPGGAGRVSRGNSDISVESVSETECRIRFSVQDEGPGISEEDQARLFRPYVQVNAGALQKAGGTGLGLSISKLIVDLFGGKIGVESSTIGRGTTFFVSVPFRVFEGGADGSQLARTGSGAPLPPRRSASRSSDGKLKWDLTCLVVDDVSAIRKMVARFLQRYGIRAVAVENGSRCIEYIHGLEEPRPDFILLDRSMPGLSGTEVVRLLRSEGCSLVTFGFTADALSEDQEEFVRAGVDDVLTKPLRRDAFTAMMTKHFSEKDGEDKEPAPTSFGLGGLKLAPPPRSDGGSEGAADALMASGGAAADAPNASRVGTVVVDVAATQPSGGSTLRPLVLPNSVASNEAGASGSD